MRLCGGEETKNRMALLIDRLRLENPVLTRELRTRMRGARAFWILFTYIGLLSLILFFTYLSWTQSQSGGSSAFMVGKLFYSVLFTVQAILVGLITPALTAGGISVEKEQRTFDLLSLSLLPRRSIVVGKLMAAVSFVTLLLTSSLPLVSLGFLLGGISPAEVGAAYFLLLVCAFQYGAVGIACSSVARSTTTATVLTYGILIVLFFSTLPFTIMGIMSGGAGYFGAPGTNGPAGGGLTALNPIGAVLGGSMTEVYFGLPVPAWLTALLINGLSGIILTLVAVHRLEFPRVDRTGLLRLLIALLTLLLALGVYGIFLPGNNKTINGYDFNVAMGLTVLIPALLAPLFVTANGLPQQGGVLSLSDPRRLRRGEAPSGLLYALLLIGLCGLVLFLGAAWGPGRGQFVSLRVPLLRLILLTVSAMWCYGSLALLLSAVTRNRWSALALTFGILVLVYLLPLSIIASSNSSNALASATVIDNAIYLTPFPAIAELSSKEEAKAIWSRLNPRVLALGRTPLYQATPAVFGGLGLLFFVSAHRVHLRRPPADS